MEPLIYCTIGRMAALCPRSTLTYLSDKPRGSLRDALPYIPLSQQIRGSLCGKHASSLLDVLSDSFGKLPGIVKPFIASNVL